MHIYSLLGVYVKYLLVIRYSRCIQYFQILVHIRVGYFQTVRGTEGGGEGGILAGRGHSHH